MRRAAGPGAARPIGGAWRFDAAGIAALQRSVGNQAVQRLVATTPSGVIQRYSAEQRKRFASISGEVQEALRGLSAPGAVEASWRRIDALWDRIQRLDGELDGDDAARGERMELSGFLTQIADAVAAQLSGIDMFREGFAPRRIAELKAQLVVLQRGDGEAFKRAGGPGKVAIQAYSLRNTLEWVSGDDAKRPSSFRAWLASPHAEFKAPADATMNCWEGVFYAALRAGRVKKPALQAIYAGGGPEDKIHAALGWGSKMTLEECLAKNKGGPKPGSVLIFLEPANHVALSLGGNKAMSLWCKPGPHPTFMEADVDVLAREAGVSLTDVYVVESCPLFS